MIVYVTAIYVLLTSVVAEGYYIPSSSMEPTLFGAHTLPGADGSMVSQPGDRVLALKGIYLLGEPRRGDVVIFRKVEGYQDPDLDDEPSSLLVKRIVGLPGEEVEIRDGWVYLRPPGETDFRPMPATRFPPGAYYENRGPYGQQGHPVRVPPGHYFVLGDNTANSSDGRVWGFLPRSHLRGRVVLRFWPPRRIGMVR